MKDREPLHRRLRRGAVIFVAAGAAALTLSATACRTADQGSGPAPTPPAAGLHVDEQVGDAPGYKDGKPITPSPTKRGKTHATPTPTAR